MSKQPPPAPTATAVGPCPTLIQAVGRLDTGSLPSTIAPPDHPILVVKDTEYNNTFPAIIGTNISRDYAEYRSKADTPPGWQTALDSLCDSAIPVKTTNNLSIRVGPGEVIARKSCDISTAVTEHINKFIVR